MRKIQILFMSILSVFIIIFSSCGNDDDGVEADKCGDYLTLNDIAEEETQEYIDAVTAYGINDSAANCTRLRNSINDIITAFEEVRDCVPADERDAYLTQLNQLREDNQTVC